MGFTIYVPLKNMLQYYFCSNLIVILLFLVTACCKYGDAAFDVDIEVTEDDGRREHWRFAGDDIQRAPKEFCSMLR